MEDKGKEFLYEFCKYMWEGSAIRSPSKVTVEKLNMLLAKEYKEGYRDGIMDTMRDFETGQV